jgi:hypothetical protein
VGLERTATLDILFRLGYVISKLQKWEEAEVFGKVAVLREKVNGAHNTMTCSALRWLGAALTEQRKFTKAESIYLTLVERGNMETASESNSALHWFCNIYEKEGKYAEATADSRSSLISERLSLGQIIQERSSLLEPSHAFLSLSKDPPRVKRSGTGFSPAKRTLWVYNIQTTLI